MTAQALAVLGSVLTTMLAAIILLAVSLTRTRERVVRLEEWTRLQEKGARDEADR